uniref:DIOX_N domain-containing protein n=1 Tax=Ascaris lumbricoides TaxID=6252 RepID=A0A0M3HH06_ASCLU
MMVFIPISEGCIINPLFQFVESAKAACDVLSSFGYWADFIDPSTGKPYLSKTETNATLNVTDEEYRSLGFEVTDMVCCKVSVFPQLQVLEFQCVEMISRASVGALLILSIGTGPLL